MPSAIVTGATGILGREIVSELSSKPVQWENIYTLSRSKKEDFGPQVKHVCLDMTASAEDMASKLQGIEADYVFFAAYMQQDTEEKETRVNGDMLDAFCRALEINGSATKLKRFILVTGAKNYGVHLGRVKIPMQETDPWLPEPPFSPNFYYRQQHILYNFTQRNNIEWVVTYSNEVLGFAKGNFMNLASAVALFAAISKELGNELVFPGSEEFYSNVTMFTDATLHAEFCHWAALEPRAANQAFNVVNGDAESWMNLWPRVAENFGLSVPAKQFTLPAPLSSERALVPEPPASVAAKSMGLEGIPQSYIRQRIDLVKWAKTDTVRQAWKNLVEREGLDDVGALDKASWAFAGFAWGRDYNVILSMTRARKLGWNGYRDSWENLERVFGELREANVIPKN